jgi:hypothetical protein
MALGSTDDARTAAVQAPVPAPAEPVTVEPASAPAENKSVTPAPAATVPAVVAMPPVQPPPAEPPAARESAPAVEVIEPADAPRNQEGTATPAEPKPEPEIKPAPSAPVRSRRPAEPKIFIPPRAPDDPGTEAADDDFRAYPASGAKA